jgi:hypothetical protein
MPDEDTDKVTITLPLREGTVERLRQAKIETGEPMNHFVEAGLRLLWDSPQGQKAVYEIEGQRYLRLVEWTCPHCGVQRKDVVDMTGRAGIELRCATCNLGGTSINFPQGD